MNRYFQCHSSQNLKETFLELDKMSSKLILKNKYKRIFRNTVKKKHEEGVSLWPDFKMVGKAVTNKNHWY